MTDVDVRVEQTRILLRSLLDYLPTPRTGTGSIVQRSAQPGEVASKRVNCPACHGNGRRRVRNVVQKCDRCAGRGRIVVDSYTGREGSPPVSDDDLRARIVDEVRADIAHVNRDASTRGTIRQQRRHAADAELARLEAASSDRAGKARPDEKYGWEKTRERMDGRGSYVAVEAALEQLQNAMPGRYRLVWAVEVLGLAIRPSDRIPVERTDVPTRKGGNVGCNAPAFVLSPVLEQELNRSLAWLADRMPAVIRVPPELEPEALAAARRESLARGRTHRHLEQRAQRDAHVRELVDQGVPLGTVARQVGLTKRRVQQVIAVATATMSR